MGWLNEKLEHFPVPDYCDMENVSYDKHKAKVWKDQEEKRIHEGFENLSGFDYFYLSKIILRDPTTGATYPPRFAWCYKQRMDTMLWCSNHKLQMPGFPPDGDAHPLIINGNTIPDPYDYMLIKPRRFGGTSMVTAFVLYNLYVHQGCSTALTSCDADRLGDLQNDKFEYAHQGCVQNGLLPEKKVGRWNTNFIQYPFKQKDDKIVKYSVVQLLNTSKDDRAAASIQGYGFKVIGLDEWFLHPRADKVRLSAKATLINKNKEKVGMLIQLGSCDAFHKDAIVRLRDTLADATSADSKIKIDFVPGWEAQVIDENGYTDVEQSMERKMKERKRLLKIAEQHPSKYIDLEDEIKSYPFSMQELVTNVATDYFSTGIMGNINKGRIYAMNYEPLQTNLFRYENNLIFPTNELLKGNITYPDNNRFPYCIYEEPKKEGVYIAGLDPIDFLGAKTRGSYFSCVMKNIITNKYVASLEFRTDDPNIGYNLFYNFMCYYKSPQINNGKYALCLAEKNKLAGLIGRCQLENTLDMLAYDPAKTKILSVTDRGYHKSGDPAFMPMLMGYTKNYLENNTIPFLRFNVGFINYDPDRKEEIEKSDIVDAVLSCEYLHNTMFLGFNKDRVHDIRMRREIIAVRNSKGELIDTVREFYK